MFDFALRSCGATVHIILQLASLCNMSIGRGVVLAVAFQKVDAAPHAKAAAQGDDQGLQYVDGTVEELHKSCFLSFCRIVVGFVCQFFCAQFVHIERLVRLHDGRSALHVPFYVKDVLLVGVGQVFVAGGALSGRTCR